MPLAVPCPADGWIRATLGPTRRGQVVGYSLQTCWPGEGFGDSLVMSAATKSFRWPRLKSAATALKSGRQAFRVCVEEARVLHSFDLRGGYPPYPIRHSDVLTVRPGRWGKRGAPALGFPIRVGGALDSAAWLAASAVGLSAASGSRGFGRRGAGSSQMVADNSRVVADRTIGQFGTRAGSSPSSVVCR